MYAYVGGTPTRGVDPTGLFDTWEGGKWGAAGAVAGAIIIIFPPAGAGALAVYGCAAAVTVSSGVAGGLEKSDVQFLIDAHDAMFEGYGSGSVGEAIPDNDCRRCHPGPRERFPAGLLPERSGLYGTRTGVLIRRVSSILGRVENGVLQGPLPEP